MVEMQKLRDVHTDLQDQLISWSHDTDRRSYLPFDDTTRLLRNRVNLITPPALNLDGFSEDFVLRVQQPLFQVGSGRRDRFGFGCHFSLGNVGSDEQSLV